MFEISISEPTSHVLYVLNRHRLAQVVLEIILGYAQQCPAGYIKICLFFLFSDFRSLV